MAGLADAAAELEALAFRLRRAGDGELVREVTRAMRDAVVPVQDEIRAGLAPDLPNRYAAALDADLRLGVNVRTGERDPGVAITGQSRSKARKLRNLDAGRLTHPVFGNREEWRTQELPSVQPGWFTRPAEAAGPRVRAGIERALADVADKAVK
ncbi:MAG TPA: hypothetical protein VGL33_21060 [Streptosporangiaceae bacterium]|jgi:hypothetical protein